MISAVSRNEIDILLQHLNSIEPSIQFTVEREMDGHIAFVAKTLLKRAESLPSNSDSRANEREYVLNVLGKTITQNVFSIGLGEITCL